MLIWDLRYGLLMLRKSSGFTIAAVLTLALGIGATTAIFTLVHQVMLRSLPVAQPGQLWRIGDSDRCCFERLCAGKRRIPPQNNWNFFSWEAYKHFRANSPAFENLAAFQVGEANAYLAVRRTGSSAPAETRNGEYVSGNFFATFGISAWRGRLFTDADDQEGAPPVAVMSFHIWQGKYGSDPSVAGATYQINGHPIHDCRSRPTRLLRSEGRQRGYARLLASADDGAADRRRNFAPQESPAGLARFDRARSPRHESENPGNTAPGPAASVAGKPSPGYELTGEGAPARADFASDTGRRRRFPDA